MDFRKKRMHSLINNEPKTHSFTLNSPAKPVQNHQDMHVASTKDLRSVKNASVDFRAYYSPRRPVKTEENFPPREYKVFINLSLMSSTKRDFSRRSYLHSARTTC